MAAGVVVSRAGRLLLTKRSAGRHLAGFWEFPGGRRRPGERLVACLRRELQEEIGVRVDVGRRLLRVRHVYPEKTVILHFYRCRIRKGRPRPLEVAAIRWVAPKDLRRRRLPPADRPLLDLLSPPRS